VPRIAAATTPVTAAGTNALFIACLIEDLMFVLRPDAAHHWRRVCDARNVNARAPSCPVNAF
jgi:hypothetical protein